MKWTVPPASVAIRSYLSTHHLWAACHFAPLAEAMEENFSGPARFEIRHRAYVVASVLDSVAFAEAAINELLQDVADDHGSYVNGLGKNTRASMQAYWRESRGRGSLLEKIQTALGVAGCQPFGIDAEPYQSAALVIQLRNLLVHFRPETVGITDLKKVNSRLRSKFKANALMAGSGNPFFPDKCLGAGCAHWSVTSVKALTDDMYRRLGVVPNYQCIAWPEDGGPDPPDVNNMLQSTAAGN